MHVAMLVDLAEDGRPTGGVQRSTVALASGLLDAGVQLTLIAPSHSHARTTRDTIWEFDVCRVPMGGRYQLPRGFIPWQSSVRRAVADIAPDLVHGQGLLHNGLAASTVRGVPSVVTAHGDPVEDARCHYSPSVRMAVIPMLKAVVRKILRNADHVLDVSPDWSSNLPCEPDSWEYVPNPLEPVFFTKRTPGRSERVLFFGDRRRIKGLDILIEAWPHVRDRRRGAELHIYGDIGATELPHGCVSHGPTSPEGVAAAMAEGGVVVLPSRYEVAPLVIPEAWAIGVPVVATDVGGVRALAEDRAILCDDSDSACLAESISTALSGGHEIEDMIARGSKTVVAHSMDYVVAAHIAAYERLLDTAR